MAIVQCDWCEKELHRVMYCSTKCRVDSFRKKKFGIKNAPLVRGEICEICNTKGRIVLDHNHQTGFFRGWLCSNCNLSLGLIKENIVTLGSMIRYLRKHGNQEQPTEEVIDRKPSKGELQAMIDAIPPRKDSFRTEEIHQEINQPTRYPYGVPYREDGNYHEDTVEL